MHWTYGQFPSESDLQQGDILKPTEELYDILREVHPHFRDTKYLAFMVSTQSCDLVRHRANPKARYIGIVVVRALHDVLLRLLEHELRPVGKGLFRTSDRGEARKLLTRIFNQNEQTQGLFYLHADGEIGLGENSVALLRIGVTLRSDHYTTLMAARRGRLQPEFQSKLGWLLGNLYGRAASPDWQDQAGGAEALEQLIVNALDNEIVDSGGRWLEDELVTVGLSARVDFQEKDHAVLCANLEKLRPKPPIERLAEEVLQVAAGIFTADEGQLRKFENRMLNNGKLRKLVQ